MRNSRASARVRAAQQERGGRRRALGWAAAVVVLVAAAVAFVVLYEGQSDPPQYSPSLVDIAASPQEYLLERHTVAGDVAERRTDTIAVVGADAAEQLVVVLAEGRLPTPAREGAELRATGEVRIFDAGELRAELGERQVPADAFVAELDGMPAIVSPTPDDVAIVEAPGIAP